MHIGHKTLLPTIFFLCFWLIFPWVYGIIISFYNYVLVRPGLISFAGLSNYIHLFASRDFQEALIQTFIYVIIILAIELLLGLGSALLLSKDFRGAGLLRVLCGLPILFIPMGSAILWKNMFMPGVGLADLFTQQLGLGVLDWWGSHLYSSLLIIMIDVWQWTPFVTIILVAALMSLPRDPFEAAKVDGLPATMVFTKITFPMITPVMIIVGILRTLDLIKLMEPVMIVSRGGVGTATLSFYVWKAVFKSMDIGLGGAVSTIYWSMAWILANILLKVFTKSLEGRR